jgi:transcriptional regulator with XRE-family HTH domain
MDKIGERIKSRIKDAGYTLTEVATLLETSPQNLSNRLGAKDVSILFVQKIAFKINQSIDFLVEEGSDLTNTASAKTAGNPAGKDAPNAKKVEEELKNHKPQNEQQMLRELLKAKDETIAALKEQVTMLKEQLKKERYPGSEGAAGPTEANARRAASGSK